VARFKSFLHAGGPVIRGLVGVGLVAVFLWNAAQFYLPGKGFTYLIEFGDREHARYLPELLAVNHYELPNSTGYDSQAYAQIAMRPRLNDPVLQRSVDSLPYRARRILFSWTAWLLAAGHPVLALNIYAVQNLGAWVLLAVLLLRWLPPSDWGRLGRWAAILFSFGLAFSVRGALPDGPSLFLIAAGMALLESGRPWLAAGLLGLTGLGKDTNVLAATALPLPQGRNALSWLRAAGQAALVVLPILGWMLCLRLWLGHGGDIGARNFNLPLTGFVRKWGETLGQLVAEGWAGMGTSVAKFDLAVLIGLSAQFLFFALRPRWRDPWWRLGASYGVLMIFLGDAVWEGYPSAAARVLLPMTLAFNLRVPKGGAWALLLLAGNLGIFGSFDVLRPPGRETFRVEGPRALRINPADGRVVEVTYVEPAPAKPGVPVWYPPEKSRLEFWRWSSGDAEIGLVNPQPYALAADVSFSLRADDRRRATVRQGGRVLWSGALEPGVGMKVALRGLMLAPGTTALRFESDRPAAYPGNNDPRPLALSLRNLRIDLRGALPRPGGR
jgi:hypothetical protein